MTEKYTFATASEALPFLCSRLLDIGDEVGSRNGRVKELLNTQIVLTDPKRREILSLNRKANVFAQIAETMWILAGRNDIEWLSAYLPRAKDFSDDGVTWRGGYGPRLRSWDNLPLGSRTAGQPGPIDQLAHVVDTLRKDPLSRRAVISIYSPDQDIPAGKDVPCNDFLQFQSRLGKLHLTVTVRSNDLMWGWSGINAFEWSTLQEIVASLLGVEVGPLVFNIGSLHLYSNHWERARRIEEDTQWFWSIPFNSDRKITTLDEVDRLVDRWFTWEAMCRTGEATKELLNDWEDPMFKAWAAAIAYYWMRDNEWLIDLRGTALAAAIARTPASVLPEPVQKPLNAPVGVGPATALNEPVRAFYEFVRDLHAEKHASYGDSWKKRGEKLSILANIARKVDRLGVGDRFDSSADTVIDLWVYLAKYLCWVVGREANPDTVNQYLGWSAGETEDWETNEGEIDRIVKDLDYYMDNVDGMQSHQKEDFLKEMLRRVAPYARDLWLAENAGSFYRGADID